MISLEKEYSIFGNLLKNPSAWIGQIFEKYSNFCWEMRKYGRDTLFLRHHKPSFAHTFSLVIYGVDALVKRWGDVTSAASAMCKISYSVRVLQQHTIELSEMIIFR